MAVSGEGGDTRPHLVVGHDDVFAPGVADGAVGQRLQVIVGEPLVKLMARMLMTTLSARTRHGLLGDVADERQLTVTQHLAQGD
jgi:hypothetical protein